MKDYVKTGTLYSARKTWQVRRYMLDVAGNYRNYGKYKDTSLKCQGPISGWNLNWLTSTREY